MYTETSVTATHTKKCSELKAMKSAAPFLQGVHPSPDWLNHPHALGDWSNNLPCTIGSFNASLLLAEFKQSGRMREKE